MKNIIYVILAFFPLIAKASQEDSKVKACLASAYVLQKDFHDAHGSYADNIQQLKWGTATCLTDFECSVSKGNKFVFEIQLKNKKSVWTVNQDKLIQQIKQ